MTPGGGEKLVGNLGAALAPPVWADAHQTDRPAIGDAYDGPGSGRRRIRGLPRGDTLVREGAAQIGPDPLVGQQLAYERPVLGVTGRRCSRSVRNSAGQTPARATSTKSMRISFAAGWRRAGRLGQAPAGSPTIAAV